MEGNDRRQNFSGQKYKEFIRSNFSAETEMIGRSSSSAPSTPEKEKGDEHKSKMQTMSPGMNDLREKIHKER